MKSGFYPLIGLLALGSITMASEETTVNAKKFVLDHESRIKPLEIEAGLAWWEANTTGKVEAFARKEVIQNKIDAALGDRTKFSVLRNLFFKKNQIDDAELRRCIEILYLQYLEKQANPEILKQMVVLSNRLEKNFNGFRAKISNQEMT